MKKVSLMILMLAVVTMTVIPFGVCAKSSAIDEEDATAIARAVFLEACGLSGEEASRYIVSTNLEDRNVKGQKSQWTVSFEYDTPYSLGFMVFSVTVTVSDGKIRNESDANAFMDFMRRFQSWEAMALAQEQLEREKGPYRDWPEDEKVAFKAKYGDTSSFAQKCHSPLPEDMQLWEAAEFAKQAIIKEYGVAREEIDALKVSGGFFEQENPKTWTIGFSDGEEAKYAVTVLSPDGSIKMAEQY